MIDATVAYASRMTDAEAAGAAEFPQIDFQKIGLLSCLYAALQQQSPRIGDQSTRVDDGLAGLRQRFDREGPAGGQIPDLVVPDLQFMALLGLDTRADDHLQPDVYRVLQEYPREVAGHNDQVVALDARGGLFA